MRCCWCEPLLDAYLENALPPRQIREVAAHARRCRSCEALLAELRVVDALLTTASPPACVGSEFTAAVVSATAQAHQHQRRSLPLWIFLALYLALGWITIGVLASQGAAGGMMSAVVASTTRAVGEAGAVISALSPGTPVLAALVSSVLLVDVALVAVLLFFVRRRMRT